MIDSVTFFAPISPPLTGASGIVRLSQRRRRRAWSPPAGAALSMTTAPG
jgi:hypothetical protein